MFSQTVNFTPKNNGNLKKFISFFGKKKPTKREACYVDLETCAKKKVSCLKLKDSWSIEGCPSPKVVIIGGGLAGLSAAARLINAGVKDLTLLEATSRLGGRIMSAWMADAMIEFGPTMLSGASVANPVFNLATLAGAVTYPVKRVKKKEKVFLTSDGKLITDYGVETLIFQQLMTEATARHALKPPSCVCTAKKNLIQYLGLRVQQELLHLPPERRLNSERIFWGMINSLRVSTGADPSSVSAEALADRSQTPGGSIVLEGGMHRILGPLLQSIPEGVICLDSPVYKVICESSDNQAKPVKVVLCDCKEFEADYVIVTLPLGVLRKKGDQIFPGVFTEEQKNAINNIGIGMKSHVYLEYAQPWWIPGMPEMVLAWGMEDLHMSTEWTKGIVSIHEVPKSRHMLTVEVAGPEAELIEKVTDEEVAVQVTRFLRKFTGDLSIPYPTNIVTTKWNSDPYFLGSTVYYGLNTTPGMFKDLGGSSSENYSGPPVGPIILAGDATIPDYYGTVEGARKSGVRAANKIIISTKSQQEEQSKKDECLKLAAEGETESAENQQSC